MGGCCAPGTLGLARGVEMVDGSHSKEMESGDSRCGNLTRLPDENVLGAIAQMIHAQESTLIERRDRKLDVERLLQLLEVAVEREVFSWLLNKDLL